MEFSRRFLSEEPRRGSDTSSSRLSSVGSTSTGMTTNPECTSDSDYEQISVKSETDNPDFAHCTNAVISSTTTTEPTEVSKRGRPRKYPIAEPRKGTHARSRTGCATCRRRKKKCDERKPTCLACEKNNVFCDGYEPLMPWKSGKDKISCSPLSSSSAIPDLPVLVNGIETEVDQFFLQHFLDSVSGAFSISDHRNAFRDIIVPLAQQNQGLMHSVLYLSSSCLVTQGKAQQHPDWHNRQEYHMSMSMRLLHHELDNVNNSSEPVIGDTTIAHTLILFLQNMGAGDISGAWRIHANALKEILTSSGWMCHDQRLQRFVEELLVHHECCAAITNLKDPLNQLSLDLLNKCKPCKQLPSGDAGVLIGVHDGLLHFVPRIRLLRDSIRRARKLAAGAHWHDNPTFQLAFTIDNELRAWECEYPVGSLRYTASLLHRQSIWLYLHRSVQPSRPSDTFHQAVEEGLQYLAMLYDFGESNVRSIVLLPLFLLGCAAFDTRQRAHITEAFERLQNSSCMRNVEPARAIVDRMWQLMDASCEEATWDWEALLAERGWDLIVS